MIESIAVIGAIADEMLRLGLQHVEIETELDQRDLVMIRGMRTDREGEAMAIHNGEDFHALAAFVSPTASPPPLAAANVASMKLSRSSIALLHAAYWPVG
ncbi:MAG: hypothetical protein K0S58_2270 [Nitrospira sp.]|nr:hypothetical protein [Nitrospira sp.]